MRHQVGEVKRHTSVYFLNLMIYSGKFRYSEAPKTILSSDVRHFEIYAEAL